MVQEHDPKLGQVDLRGVIDRPVITSDGIWNPGRGCLRRILFGRHRQSVLELAHSAATAAAQRDARYRYRSSIASPLKSREKGVRKTRYSSIEREPFRWRAIEVGDDAMEMELGATVDGTMTRQNRRPQRRHCRRSLKTRKTSSLTLGLVVG